MRFDPERNNPGFSPQHNYRTLRGAFFDGIEIDQRGEGGFTPLNVTLYFAHQELASYLISAGADTSVIGAKFKFDPERNKEHWRGMVVEINALE